MMNTRSKTKNKRHQSGALVASKYDLLIEILLRLPVTSILRFKSVSKHWLCLLSHRHFTTGYDNYNNFSKSPAGLFDYSGELYVPFDVQNRSTPRPFRGLNFCCVRQGFSILQSCNGLLLCRKGYGDSRKYYVLNPTTKQFAVLPSVPGGQRVRQSIRFMALAFHPTDFPHYKVVCIRNLHIGEAYLYQVLTYSSDTRKWKVSVESFSVYDPPLLDYGVYWNGSIHWPSRYPIHLYFKLDVEQLQTLPLPPEMISTNYLFSKMYFGESSGHLHLILRFGPDNLQMNVYELSDHLGWFVKYQVDLVVLTRAFPEMFRSSFCDFKVIDVVIGEEEEEDTFVVLVTPGKMITYNVHDKSFKQIYRVVSCFITYHSYTNTLTCF
ncbi:F-box protein At5g07610-like [Bidens hawaiensis]|uniref:F-box protein At5g07610-like n=1 Tax=Bidens hawaiensis TaxID=980011 RepID=UPI00404B8127